MSSISSLSNLYIHGLKDLWSANDQMAKALKKMAPKATSGKLKVLLTAAPQGIAGHIDLLKALIASQGEKVSKEHCKGAEGLVSEAIRQTIDGASEREPGALCRHHRAVPVHDPFRHQRVRDDYGILQRTQAVRRQQATQDRCRRHVPSRRIDDRTG